MYVLKESFTLNILYSQSEKNLLNNTILAVTVHDRTGALIDATMSPTDVLLADKLAAKRVSRRYLPGITPKA